MGDASEAFAALLLGLPLRSRRAASPSAWGAPRRRSPSAGRPLICRLVERVDPIADEILITTNEPENLGFLDEMPQASKIRLQRDLLDFRGSLAGLLTALTVATHD